MDLATDDEACIAQLHIRDSPSSLPSSPDSFSMPKRSVTYAETSPRVQVTTAAAPKGLFRRRSESRGHGSDVPSSISLSNLTVAAPAHKLSRDGVHYISPYPSPSLLEVARHSPTEELLDVEASNKSMCMATGEQKNGEGKNQGCSSDGGVPVTLCDKGQSSCNMTDGATTFVVHKQDVL